jgi:hypothetical protein
MRLCLVHLETFRPWLQQSGSRATTGLFSSEVNHDPFLPLARAADYVGEMELGNVRGGGVLLGLPWLLPMSRGDLQALTGGPVHFGTRIGK